MATEKRLIDANALLEHIKSRMLVTYPNLYPGMFKANEIIKSFPSVDAKETVYGQWKLIPNHEALGCCSVCKYKPAFVSYKYCPNCGADMRGNGNG